MLLGGMVVVTVLFWQLSRQLMVATVLRPEAVAIPLGFGLALGLLLLGSAGWAGLSTWPGRRWLRPLAALVDLGALLALGLGGWQLMQELQPVAEGETSPLIRPMLLLLCGSFGLLLLGTLASLLYLTWQPGRKTLAPWFRHFLSLLWLYLLLFFWFNL
jgi:hypothetical protein